MQHNFLTRVWFALTALLAFALAPGAAQAQSQLLVPSVLEEMRLVTADDSAATFILRFSPAEPRYAVVERNPTRPELVMATSLKTGRVPDRQSFRGLVRFVLAAGNESQNAANSSPARANGPNVYTISSFAVGDNWSSFSNFGNPPVDFAEPGSAIRSTWIGSGYNTISGTSMAAPHFAGILLQGAPGNGGRVNGDPDGNPDTIGIVP